MSALLLFLTLMGGAGCSKEGTYVLSLKFQTSSGSTEDVTPYGCGFHGVAAWYLTETGEDAGTYPCGKSTLTRTTKPGSYQIIVRARDAEGNPKLAPGDIDGASLYLSFPLLPGAWPDVKVEADKTTTVTDPVVFTPIPQCEDGVDNDCDGRVDLQDPACAKEPGHSCSTDLDCTTPGFPFCNKVIGACLPDVPELGADDPVGSGCVNMKKDGGATEPDADNDASQGQGGQGGQAGGQGGQAGGQPTSEQESGGAGGQGGQLTSQGGGAGSV